MVQDGMMERFAIDEVYGMHNFPGLPLGAFSIRSGPVMAATDDLAPTRIGSIAMGSRRMGRPHASIPP